MKELGRVGWLCIAALGAVGCVSSGTWQVVHDVDRSVAHEEPPPISDSEIVDCRTLARAIEARFPGLSAYDARARAAAARARAEGSLPAPELMLEIWDFPIGDPQRADREGMYMIGLAQSLPPPDVLDGLAREQAELGRAELAELAERRREIRRLALSECAEAARASLERDRIARSRETLARMRELAELRQTTRGGGLSAIARLDVEVARSEREIAAAELDRERARRRLAVLFGQEVPEGLELALPEVELDEEALTARALTTRGSIEAARARSRAARAALQAARARASVPTFRLGATYMQMPGGRPGLGAQIGLDLPWLWSGEGAQSEAAQAEAAAADDEIETIEREVAIQVAEWTSELQQSLRVLTILRERERPAALRALESLEAGYASGAVELDDWLAAVRALRELDVEEAGWIGRVARSIAELESAIGGPIGGAP